MAQFVDLLFLASGIIIIIVLWWFFSVPKRSPQRDSYEHFEAWLSQKIIPGSEENVRAQLLSLENRLPPTKRAAFRAYVEGKSWKKVFVKT